MNSNTTAIIIVSLLAALGAYWYFFTGSGNQPPISASTALQNPAQTQFQALVSQLQPISFDTAIFSDPNFLSLIDITTPVTPEASGRPDPFAVLPATSAQ